MEGGEEDFASTAMEHGGRLRGVVFAKAFASGVDSTLDGKAIFFGVRFDPFFGSWFAFFGRCELVVASSPSETKACR